MTSNKLASNKFIVNVAFKNVYDVGADILHNTAYGTFNEAKMYAQQYVAIQKSIQWNETYSFEMDMHYSSMLQLGDSLQFVQVQNIWVE